MPFSATLIALALGVLFSLTKAQSGYQDAPLSAEDCFGADCYSRRYADCDSCLRGKHRVKCLQIVSYLQTKSDLLRLHLISGFRPGLVVVEQHRNGHSQFIRNVHDLRYVKPHKDSISVYCYGFLSLFIRNRPTLDIGSDAEVNTHGVGVALLVEYSRGEHQNSTQDGTLQVNSLVEYDSSTPESRQHYFDNIHWDIANSGKRKHVHPFYAAHQSNQRHLPIASTLVVKLGPSSELKNVRNALNVVEDYAMYNEIYETAPERFHTKWIDGQICLVIDLRFLEPMR